MKNTIISLLVVFLGLWASPTPDSGTIDFEFSSEGQKNPNWCYAGATKLLFDYFRIATKSQEQIVSDLVNSGQDCSSFINCYPDHKIDSKSPCNKVLPPGSDEAWVYYINQVLSIEITNPEYEIVDFDVDKIKYAIKGKKGPIIALFGINGGLSHAVIISDFYVINQRWSLSSSGNWKDKTILFHVINPGKKDCQNCKQVIFYDVKKRRIVRQIDGAEYETNFSIYNSTEGFIKIIIPKIS